MPLTLNSTKAQATSIT